MSLYSAMETSISGMEANGQALTVVSHNITNANTTGFKSARGEFHDFIYKDLMGTVTRQVGQGSRMAGVTTLFHQGSLMNTERATDVAIDGGGFFVVKRGDQGKAYTRDGSFRFDKQGWLTTLSGQHVQAYKANSSGSITGELGDVRLPSDNMPAKATNRVQVHLNLDARSEPFEVFSWDRPQETAQFSTSTQIYDSLGNTHEANLFFNKADDGEWEWVAMVDGGDLDGGEPGKFTAIAQGALVFDEKGRLELSEQELIDTTFAKGAEADQDLVFDFGDAIDIGGTGLRGTTQYGAKSSVFRNVQDGYTSGKLVDVNIGRDGVVAGVYSNGVHRNLAQLAVARFEANEKLYRVGGNQYVETSDSGTAMIGHASTNGRGNIVGGSLERSNVDLAKEFIDMIRAQRGFQASAKSVHTADSMLDEVIALGARR